MNETKYHFTDEELEQDIGHWEINPLSKGFASSYKTLYKTNFTTIAAKAFLIPNKETGEIHHFNLSIRIFKRVKKSEPWEEQLTENENPFGAHRQINLDAGSGKAVRELTDFLLAQYELIGTKVESAKVVINKPTDLDIEDLLSKMSLGQIENFSHGIKVQTLKQYKQFLLNNLDQNETFIQNWLDEDNSRYRKQRCLIFGLEFIDHKREGELSRKRFDILTRSSMNKNEYVIIELKSPCDDVFKIVENSTANEGSSVEYHLSQELARAIPQILRYKSKFENVSADDDDLRRIGIEKGTVKKCIIVLGKSYEDPIWEDHYISLKTNLSNVLEIWKYTDIIEKLDITIKNLEHNLSIE